MTIFKRILLVVIAVTTVFSANAEARFLSPDPVRVVDQNGRINQVILANPQRLNQYVYGLNNPYRYVDPGGEIPIPLITGAIGGVIGGAYNGITNWSKYSGSKWWRSVGVGAASGFVAGSTGVGGAVTASTLNEVHEQTLQGRTLDNLDNVSVGYAAAGGFVAGQTGKATAGLIKGRGQKMLYKPTVLQPIDLKKMAIAGSQGFDKAGKISAVPASSAAENLSQKHFKKKKKR